MLDEEPGSGRRTAVVTGGTGGIGRAVAVELARRGYRVLIVGRDAARGSAVLAALDEAHPGGDHALIRADLALLRDTAHVADEIARRTDRLDAVMLCAGVLSTVAEWTDENLERGLVLNYLSRYLLLRRLLPLLAQAPSGRVVLVANAGKYRDTLDLDERVRGSRIVVTCVFPGVVATDVLRNARGLARPVRAAGIALQRLAASPATAAQTPVFLADDPAAARLGGTFFG